MQRKGPSIKDVRSKEGGGVRTNEPMLAIDRTSTNANNFSVSKPVSESDTHLPPSTDVWILRAIWTWRSWTASFKRMMLMLDKGGGPKVTFWLDVFDGWPLIGWNQQAFEIHGLVSSSYIIAACPHSPISPWCNWRPNDKTMSTISDAHVTSRMWRPIEHISKIWKNLFVQQRSDHFWHCRRQSERFFWTQWTKL